MTLYAVAHKKVALYFCRYLCRLLTNSTFFHWRTLQTIFNNVIIIYPTTR